MHPRVSDSAQLLYRGMLTPDPKGSVKYQNEQYSIMMGDDHPYAADGMLIWNALHTWIAGYLGTYYTSQKAFDDDTELHNWWVGWVLVVWAAECDKVPCTIYDLELDICKADPRMALGKRCSYRLAQGSQNSQLHLCWTAHIGDAASVC